MKSARSGIRCGDCFRSSLSPGIARCVGRRSIPRSRIPPTLSALDTLQRRGQCSHEVPKAKPSKSKAARNDANQMELTDQSWRKVAARSAAAPEEIENYDMPRRKLSHRLWNALVGLGMVPFAWIFTDALFKTLSKASNVPFWMSHDFLMFGFGAAGWLVWLCASFAFLKRPTPISAYVFGHEMMHMLMARLSKGRIKDYHISSEGGFIVTNKYNFLIALAPYLWPFYSVPVLAAWSVSLYWPEALRFRELFLAALGLTWMFHLTFTLWVLPRGQSDLLGPGRIFSVVVIYLANAFLLGTTLVMIAPEITWREYGGHLWASTKLFYQWAGDTFGQAVGFAADSLKSRSRG